MRFNRHPGVDVPDLVFSGPFTVEGWIRFEDNEPIDNRDILVASGSGQPTQNLNFFQGFLRLYSPGSGTADKIIARTRAVENVWTHFALTRDGAGNLTIYINGIEDATGAAPFALPRNIGRNREVDFSFRKVLHRKANATS